MVVECEVVVYIGDEFIMGVDVVCFGDDWIVIKMCWGRDGCMMFVIIFKGVDIM